MIEGRKDLLGSHDAALLTAIPESGAARALNQNEADDETEPKIPKTPSIVQAGAAEKRIRRMAGRLFKLEDFSD